MILNVEYTSQIIAHVYSASSKSTTDLPWSHLEPTPSSDRAEREPDGKVLRRPENNAPCESPSSLCPVLPIGAENLPGEITAQGSAVAQQPTRRRRALDGDLARRDDARHGGRAARGFAWRGVVCCVTAGHHRPGGSGDGRPASARRARQRPHARGRGLSRRPRRGEPPVFPAGAIGLVVLPVSVHALPSRPARTLARSQRAEARRWRAAGAPLKP